MPRPCQPTTSTPAGTPLPGSDTTAPATAAEPPDRPGHRVAGPAPGSEINANDWTQTTDVGFEEGAVVAMAPTDAEFRTVYFGFGFEGVTSADQRNALMGRAIDYLLAP